MNILTVFQRAAAGVALSAPERALLKALKGVVYTAVLAAAAAAFQMISTGHFVLTQTSVDAVVGAGLMAGMVALEKAFTAQGDAKTAAAAPAPLHQQAAPPPASGSAI